MNRYRWEGRGLVFWSWGELGFGVPGSGFWVPGFEPRIKNFEPRTSNIEHWVLNFGEIQ